jgi:single-stranded DNA-binding protein
MAAILTLIGHLGGNPEQRNFDSGLKIVQMRVATTKRMKSGEEITNWYSCTIFTEYLQRTAMTRLLKGSKVVVVGTLLAKTGKDGKTYLEVVVDNLVLVSEGKPVNHSESGERVPYESQSVYGEHYSQPDLLGSTSAPPNSEDIPF